MSLECLQDIQLFNSGLLKNFKILSMCPAEKNHILLYKVVRFFCLQRRISLIDKLIWLSFILKLLIVSRNVFNYFRGENLQPLKRNHPQKNYPLQKKFTSLFKTKIKMRWIEFHLTTLHPKCHKRPLGAQPLVMYIVLGYI